MFLFFIGFLFPLFSHPRENRTPSSFPVRYHMGILGWTYRGASMAAASIPTAGGPRRKKERTEKKDKMKERKYDALKKKDIGHFGGNIKLVLERSKDKFIKRFSAFLISAPYVSLCLLYNWTFKLLHPLLVIRFRKYRGHYEVSQGDAIESIFYSLLFFQRLKFATIFPFNKNINQCNQPKPNQKSLLDCFLFCFGEKKNLIICWHKEHDQKNDRQTKNEIYGI